jgi:preprotein translocase subunit SecE
MNNINEKVKDISIGLAIGLSTLLAFFTNYHYNLSSPMRILLWLCWLSAIVIMSYLTVTGQKVFLFAQEARNELTKIVWPTRQETIQTTSIVIIMVIISGFILWAIDFLMVWIIAKLTHLG